MQGHWRVIRKSRLQFYGFHNKKIYALYRIIKINETCDLWHSACLRSMPKTTMTLHIRKQFSILGEQGNKPIYFRGTRERLSCLFIRLSTRHIKLCLWSTDGMYAKTCILIVLSILFKHTLQCVTPYHDQHHICRKVCSRDIWSVIVVFMKK